MTDPLQPSIPQLRLFIAITLPEPVKQAISAAQAELRRALPSEALRWTRSEQFHLTLKFLGNVPASGIDPLRAAVEAACEGFSPLDMTAAGVGAFPNLHRPRVLWVGVTDLRVALADLQSVVEQASAPFTEEQPEGRFSGHVTLARIRDIGAREREVLAKAAERMASAPFGKWTAECVEIIRSELSSKGARYTTLAAVPLPGS